MKLPVMVLGAAAMAALFSMPAAAQDAPQKTALCTTCHGQRGIGLLPDTPHLAGQPAIYLSAQLKAFRSGARRHEVMQVIAKGLADEDIEQLAAWYAAQQIELRQR
jgi:cytochrome c553